MSETAPGQAPGGAEAPSGQTGGGQPGGDASPIMIAAQYIKDLSFEIPAGPALFTDPPKADQPDIGLDLDVQVEGLSDVVFEVTLEINATCKAGESTVYLAELKYSGLFQVNVPDEHKAPVLFIECARLLFPFARKILADVTQDGGFQPLLMGPMDFAQIFEQNMAKLQAEQEGAAGEA